MNGKLLRQGDQLAATIILAVGILLTAFAYAPGLGGTFHFDDPPNLRALSEVHDRASAIAFILEGKAGPLGRPIALASFVPQAYAWPASPSTFLYVNICLHLLNGVLVTWLAYLLLSSAAPTFEPAKASRTAALAGVCWMLLPILASSSLLVIQRMTLLSATFLFAGFIGYLAARRHFEQRPLAALLMMTASLLVGSAAAALAKENGILLPLMILATEATLLPKVAGNRRILWRTWQIVFLIFPSVVLIGYIVASAQYSESTLLARNFTSSERLLTQAHILWEYVLNAFLPRNSTLGPFHDDYAVHRDFWSPLSITAMAAWLTLLGASALTRRRLPLLAFAVAWYLGGHVLESTTLALELYFEHRNYVPLVGPAIAIVACVASAPRYAERLLSLGLYAYLVTLSVVLFNTTSLWGNPPLAGEYWAIQHPDSVRANQYLAQQLMAAGDSGGVRRVLQRFSESHPDSASVGLQTLLLNCIAEPDKSQEAHAETLRAGLKSARFEHAVFETLSELYRTVRQHPCGSINGSTVYDLAQSAAANPAFKGVPVAYHNLHILMSEEAFEQRDLNLTMHHIEEALSSNYTLPTLRLAVDVLMSAGLYAEAQDFADDARSRAPRNPLRSRFWHRQLSYIQERLETQAAVTRLPLADPLGG